MNFLSALTNTAALLNRSSRQEAEVFRIFRQQITGSGLSGNLCLLAETDKYLKIWAIAHADLPDLGEFSDEDAPIPFPLEEFSTYQEVISSSLPLYRQVPASHILPVYPRKVERMANIEDVEVPAIFVPCFIQERNQGVLAVFGTGLSPQDIPTFETFSNLIALALENARLNKVELQPKSLSRQFANEKWAEETRRLESANSGIMLHRPEGSIVALQKARADLERRVEERTAELEALNQQLKREIEERSRAEAGLRESEEHYRTLVENIPIGVYRTTPGPQGHFLMVNRAFLSMLGYETEEEVRVINVANLYVDPSKRKEFSDSLLTHGSLTGVELQLQKKDGTRIWGSVTARVMSEPGREKVIYFDCTIEDITERKQAEAEVLRRAQELTMLHAVSLDITAPHDFPTLLKTIVERATRLLKTPGGHLGLCDPERQEIRLSADVSPVKRDVIGIVRKYGEGASGLVALTGEPSIINDYQAWPGCVSVHENDPPFTSVLSVPLIWQGRMIGVLQVMDDDRSRYFTETDLELLTLFANQAAIAIENARLFQVEEKRVAQLESLRQASLGLTASLDLESVLDAILEGTLQLLPGLRNGHIFLYHPEAGGRLTFGAALWQDGRRGKPLYEPRTGGLTYSVARSGELILVPNMRDHPLYVGAPADWTGSIVGLPLKIGLRVVGVMNVSHAHTDAFSQDDLRVLRLLGDQAAIAIENARLFEQVAVERRHLSLLYDVGRELAASLDPDEILERATTLTCQALNGLMGEAFVYLPDEERLSMRALFGRAAQSAKFYKSRLSLRLGEGLAGWVALRGQPVIIPDVNNDPHWLCVPNLDDDARSAIVSPILQGEHLLGVLTVLHKEPDAFSNDHLELLQAICQQVGLAFSNASRYQQVQRRLAENTLIQSLTQAFSQRLELQILLNEVATQLVHRLGYSQVEIFLREGDFLRLHASEGCVAEEQVLPISRGIVGRVARTGQVAFVPDVSDDPDYVSGVVEAVAELAVPICRGETVVGVINIESQRADQLSAQDRDLLQVLAGQISVALENAVLYERVRRYAEDLEATVAQRTAELTELYELSQEIGFCLSYEELLKMLLHHLHNAVRSELVAGCLEIGDHCTFFIETDAPLDQAVTAKIRSYWLSVDLNCFPAEQDDQQLNFDIFPAASYDEQRTSIPQIPSVIQAPIIIAGKTVGLLLAGSDRPEAFRAEHERLLNTFANQASAAAQRLATILTAQQKRLEYLVEHLPVGVLLLDAEYKLLVANPLGREILANLDQKKEDGVLSWLGPYPVRELISHHRDPLPVEIALDGPPKRVFEAQARLVGSEEEADKRQWVLTVREVTQERENQARIQMQERLATVGQLAAGIAHDFNNIMAAIMVYIDLLRSDQNLLPNSIERLTIIAQQVQRAASLIRQILDFSRRSVMEQSVLDLLPFIKELDKLLDRLLPETIRLELSYQPEVYLVKADPTRLQQVFMNLAVNARDAMPEGGSLHFELGRFNLKPGEPPPCPDLLPGEWIWVSVRDSGAGIPTEALSHIFEPFFTTKPIGEGTGLGLAQAYGIIKQHDGHIEAYSRPEEGTTFIIYLPALPIPQTVIPVPEAIPVVSGGGKTILIVEDDQVTREALKALMESQNYYVLTAADGEEALQIYTRDWKTIALVVSDVVMPKMGGVALYRALMERWPEVKMLFITGHPLQGENQALLAEGGVAWLQKPFSVPDLNQAIQTLLEEEKDQ